MWNPPRLEGGTPNHPSRFLIKVLIPQSPQKAIKIYSSRRKVVNGTISDDVDNDCMPHTASSNEVFSYETAIFMDGRPLF